MYSTNISLSKFSTQNIKLVNSQTNKNWQHVTRIRLSMETNLLTRGGTRNAFSNCNWAGTEWLC